MCPRCGHILTAPAADGLTRSLAFALAALLAWVGAADATRGRLKRGAWLVLTVFAGLGALFFIRMPR